MWHASLRRAHKGVGGAAEAGVGAAAAAASRAIASIAVASAALASSGVRGFATRPRQGRGTGRTDPSRHKDYRTSEFDDRPHFARRGVPSIDNPGLRPIFARLDFARQKGDYAATKANEAGTPLQDHPGWIKACKEAGDLLKELFVIESGLPTALELRLTTRDYKDIFFRIKALSLHEHAWPFFQLFQLHCQLHWKLEIQQKQVGELAHRVPARVVGLVLHCLCASPAQGPQVAATALEWMAHADRIAHFDIVPNHYSLVLRWFTDPVGAGASAASRRSEPDIDAAAADLLAPQMAATRVKQARAFFARIPATHKHSLCYQAMLKLFLAADQIPEAVACHTELLEAIAQRTLPDELLPMASLAKSASDWILEAYLRQTPVDHDAMKAFCDAQPQTPLLSEAELATKKKKKHPRRGATSDEASDAVERLAPVESAESVESVESVAEAEEEEDATATKVEPRWTGHACKPEHAIPVSIAFRDFSRAQRQLYLAVTKRTNTQTRSIINKALQTWKKSVASGIVDDDLKTSAMTVFQTSVDHALTQRHLKKHFNLVPLPGPGRVVEIVEDEPYAPPDHVAPNDLAVVFGIMTKAALKTTSNERRKLHVTRADELWALRGDPNTLPIKASERYIQYLQASRQPERLLTVWSSELPEHLKANSVMIEGIASVVTHLVESGAPEAVARAQAIVEQINNLPNITSLSSTLPAFSAQGDVTSAERLWSQFESKGFTANVAAITAMIQVHLVAGAKALIAKDQAKANLSDARIKELLKSLSIRPKDKDPSSVLKPTLRDFVPEQLDALLTTAYLSSRRNATAPEDVEQEAAREWSERWTNVFANRVLKHFGQLDLVSREIVLLSRVRQYKIGSVLPAVVEAVEEPIVEEQDVATPAEPIVESVAAPAAAEPTVDLPAASTPAASTEAPAGAPKVAASSALPISLLLLRLSDRRWSAEQASSIILHVLHAHGLLEADQAFKPTAEVATPTEPLSAEGFETLLAAAQQREDLDTFGMIWTIMERALPLTMPPIIDEKGQASVASFEPTPVMHLCRLTLLLAHRRFADVESTFGYWRAASPTGPNAPTLIAYNLVLKSLVDSAEPEVAKKALKLWHEMKVAIQATQPQEPQDATKDAATSTTDAASFRPAHSTFHLLLQSLLVTASSPATVAPGKRVVAAGPTSGGHYALQQLTPLLLDMEHQFGLEADWAAYALSFHVLRACTVAAGSGETPTKRELVAVRNARALMRQQAWAKGETLWKAVLAKSDKLAEVESKSGKAASSSSPSVVPAAVWFAWLDLALASGTMPTSNTAVFDALASMHSIGLLPSPVQCEAVLARARTLGEQRLEPPPAKGDEEDRRIAGETWRTQLRAVRVEQERAADISLQMLRCLSTHAQASTAKSAAPAAAVDTADAAAPAPAMAAPSLQVGHYLSTLTILSSVCRLTEFAALWRHFQAEYSSLDSTARLALAPQAMDTMLQAALRMDVEIPGEGPSPAPRMAYSVLCFFANVEMPATTAAPTTEVTEPTTPAAVEPATEEADPAFITALSSALPFASASTRTLLQRSLLAADLTREFESVLLAARATDAAATEAAKKKRATKTE